MPTISTLTVDVTARTARFRSAMRGVGLALGALGVAAGYAFKQFEDAEKVQKQTEAVIKSTGGAAKVTAGHVDDLSQSISGLTGIDDEAIAAGENLLLTFTNIRNEVGKGNDVFDRATMAITDMSVALGQDMKSSAIQVGKALQDPILGITALRRVGVSFTKSQADMVAKWVEQGDILKAQRFILDELATEFGGSAEAQKTASQTMATALGNLAEVVGEVLAPAVTAILAGVTTFVTYLQNNLGPALAAVGGWFRRLWDKIGPVVLIIRDELVEAFTQAWREIQNHVIPALRNLWERGQPVWILLGQIAAVIGKLAAEVFPVLFTVLGIMIEWWSRQIQAIGMVITWVKRLIGWIAEKFMAAWNTVKGPVIAVINAIAAAVGFLIDRLEDAVNLLRDLVGLNNVSDTVRNALIEGGYTPRAMGGPVSAGQAYVVGERGPELFVPGSSGSIVPSAGGVSITINGDVTDPDRFARKVEQALNRAAARH